jgi:hypothetical protein
MRTIKNKALDGVPVLLPLVHALQAMYTPARCAVSHALGLFMVWSPCIECVCIDNATKTCRDRLRSLSTGKNIQDRNVVDR